MDTPLMSIFVFMAFLIAVVAMFFALYAIYRVAMFKNYIVEKFDKLEGRFKLLIEAINKANYSEYLNDMKQGEDIDHIKRSTGL